MFSGVDGYRPYHQTQVESRCGLHAINNAYGEPRAATPRDAEHAAQTIARAEANIIDDDENPIQPLALAGGNMCAFLLSESSCIN